MAKILFICWPASGHINPSLSLLGALTRNGHQVHYFTDQKFAAKITPSGAQFRSFAVKVDNLRILKNPNLLQMVHGLARENMKLLQAHCQEWKNEQYDCIIHDSMLSCGYLFGRMAGIPSVNSHTMFAANEAFVRSELSFIEIMASLKNIASGLAFLRLRSRLRKITGIKLSMIEFLCPKSDQVIVYTSALFQIRSELFDPNRYLFVGPALQAREVRAQPYPALIRAKIENKKVLYISLGTLFNNNRQFFQNCLRVFKDLQDTLVLISIGTSIRPEELGDVPDHFVLADFMPQLEILAQCDLFVTHGGMNSVSESILNSTPMIVCPQQREQLAVAKRVSALGAGVYLKKSDQLGPKLSWAWNQMIDTYAEKLQHVKRIRASFENASGIPGAIVAIENLLNQ